ncbi:MAG: DUF4281 domain-containing protein [Leptolyngbya sp. SIO4C1]|nr:DUF4281 domain-containing protein [Leptolyngbya sp. SIO4C1]
MILDYIFNFGNVFVLPFWVLMVLVPNWAVTRRVMASYIPFVILAGLYVYCFANSLDPDSAAAFANPTLSVLTSLFADPRVMATGWVHFLAMDLFVGRYIYWKGQETGVWTRHSLALCLFAGPAGLLSHILTTWVYQRFEQAQGNPTEAAG